MPYNVVEMDEPETISDSLNESQTEQALVTSARRGEAQAFEKLVKRYEPRILALALRYTRVREDAEDVVQQSFQKAFVYLPRFEGKSRFSTWLMRIAINEALMLLRKRRSSPEIPILETVPAGETDVPFDFPCSDPSPEDSCLHEEQKRILSAAMRQLNPRSRQAVELRELGDLSTEETARILGVSIGAVKARLFYARRKLRKSLRRYVGSAWTRRKALHESSASSRHISDERLIYNACG